MKKSGQVHFNGQWLNPKHVRAFVYKVDPNSETGFVEKLAENHGEYVKLLGLGWSASKNEAKEAGSLDTETQDNKDTDNELTETDDSENADSENGTMLERITRKPRGRKVNEEPFE